MVDFISKIIIVNQGNKEINVFYEGMNKIHICDINLDNNEVSLYYKNKEHSELVATIIALVGNLLVDTIRKK